MTRGLPLLTARWAVALALALTAFALGAFGYVYVSASRSESRRIDIRTSRELRDVARDPARAAGRVSALLASDEHRTLYAGIFDARGRRLAGNLERVPPAVRPGDGVVETTGVRSDARGRKVETMRAAAVRLPKGTVVAIGYDLDARDAARRDLAVAIVEGVVPSLGVAIAVAIALAIASRRRVRAIESALERIVAGDFGGRLPVAGGRWETDRIASAVNRMLDAIEMLYGEVRGVGDDMAHDLRTPLGRVRAQLERSRDAPTLDALRDAVDRAIAGLDQALTIIVAISRIGEIEHRARRSGFAPVELDTVARAVIDFYAPVAEDAGVDLHVATSGLVTIEGDRDLIFEALANLVDNAVKFVPAGGRVSVAVSPGGATGAAGDGATIVVADDGPGVPEAEREAVLGRFVRGDRSRHVPGSGLGLSLVAAIARLHGATLGIGDAAPGCRAEIRFPPGPGHQSRSSVVMRP